MKTTKEEPVVALYSVSDVRTLRDVKRRLTEEGLKLAQVSRDWIWRQCFSMERTQILARNVQGDPVAFVFSWGKLREGRPEITTDPMVVAVEVGDAESLPAGAWRYDPIRKAITLSQFLGGEPIGELVRL